MFYVMKAPNGTPMICGYPPKDKPYIKVESLPDGDGPLLFTPFGELFRGAAVIEPEPVDTEPTQLDILEAQVTYTAMITDTLLEV